MAIWRTALTALFIFATASGANAACDPFPESEYLGNFLHEQVNNYVSKAHNSDWAPYLAMLQGNVSRLQAIQMNGDGTMINIRGSSVDLSPSELIRFAKTDPDAMTLDTPLATIGIRSTQVGPDILDGESLNFHLMEELSEFVGEVVVVNDGGVKVLNDANAFTQVSSFDAAPSPFSIVTVEDILTAYGEATLPYLPPRNSQGERTIGNTYENVNDNVEGDDHVSLDFLNDFQTDARGNDGFDENFVGVTGDIATLNNVEQARGDLTDVNKFVDEEETDPDDDNDDNDNNNGDDGDTISEPEPIDPLPANIRDLVYRGIIGEDAKMSNNNQTVEADALIDFDFTDYDYNWVITGGDGNDAITTGDGNDTLDGGAGDDYLSCGDGDDLFIGAPGAGDDTCDGGADNDTITFAASDDGGEDGIGLDTLIDIENAIGGSGNDIIMGDDGVL
jgi:hypothetical protein